MAKKKKSSKSKKKEPATRKEALELTVKQIEKQFGDGSIMPLGGDQHQHVPSVSTGSLSLDIALGVGGLPRSRVAEIYGPEGSGKTTLALHLVANAQKNGGIAAYIDVEHALDPSYMTKLGVNVDELLVNQPDTGEQALEIAEMLVRSNAVDAVVIDSVAALVPRAEIEGEMGDAHVGLQARLMSQALRKLTGVINRSRTLMIFINQIRMKIGVMFGSPETTPGGRALKFYSSVRLDVRRIGSIKDDEDVVGSRTRVVVKKNKVAPPFRKAQFDLLYDHGISREGDVIDLGVEHEIIEKKGSWFSYGETKLGQGREAVRTLLEDNIELRDEIETKILEAVGMTDIRKLQQAQPDQAIDAKATDAESGDD